MDQTIFDKENYLTAIVFLESEKKEVRKYRNIKNSERHLQFFYNFLCKRYKVKSINFYGKQSRKFLWQQNEVKAT
jgi:hypothetical protein